MDTETKYLPYIFALTEIAEEKKLLKNCVDKKKIYFFLKRVADIVISFLFIVFILSWLLPIISLLIKIDSKGPVFFLQKRAGKNGVLFTCYKFRTMIINDYADDIPATENDMRITRIGKFLRKSNMDEFPQFINILLGSMSLIGPRPHMVADCRRFSFMIPEYNSRNFIKPGITGLAQVKGLHGPALNFDSIFLRYQYDTFYVRNAGFLLDVRIIRKTAAEHIKAVWILLRFL
jgi:putative colanic acid biosysnthesis UDP-glucose lipid carrier transferase